MINMLVILWSLSVVEMTFYLTLRLRLLSDVEVRSVSGRNQ